MTGQSSDQVKIQGVGGWLGFLVFTLVFGGPVIGLLMTYTGLGVAETHNSMLAGMSEWLHYKYAAWLLFLCAATLSIWAGVALMKGTNRIVVTFAVICLWLTGPLVAIIDGWALFPVLMGIRPAAEYDAQVIGRIISASFAPAIWTIYLLRSKRVRNTYA